MCLLGNARAAVAEHDSSSAPSRSRRYTAGLAMVVMSGTNVCRLLMR